MNLLDNETSESGYKIAVLNKQATGENDYSVISVRVFPGCLPQYDVLSGLVIVFVRLIFILTGISLNLIFIIAG